MTSAQHHKIIAFSLVTHSLVVGLAAILFSYPFFENLLKNIYYGDGIQQMVGASVILLAILYGGFFLFLILPQLIGGFVMLIRKKPSKTAGIIAAIFALVTIPVGTIIGIYSLWFFMSEKGKRFYAENREQAG